jgi:UDP-glucose 4-epimerase
MTTLITGGAGYIGSHIAYALVDAKKNVVVIDDLSTGNRSLVDDRVRFYKGDIADENLVAKIIAAHKIENVIHCAGSIIVPDSLKDPLAYYKNNTSKSLNLIETCVSAGISEFVFSSSAAVYAESFAGLLTEESRKAPSTPYGRSKLVVEWFLQDVARAHQFRYGILRYFNVAGADPKGRAGQTNPNSLNLLKRAALVALGACDHLDIFGTDFQTSDGTAVRDYIHVSDLAQAHILVLEHLRKGGVSKIYNCGYGHGITVRQVVKAVEDVTGRPLPTQECARRAGDVQTSISDPSRIKAELGWKPSHTSLEEMVRSVMTWETRLMKGTASG